MLSVNACTSMPAFTTTQPLVQLGAVQQQCSLPLIRLHYRQTEQCLAIVQHRVPCQAPATVLTSSIFRLYSPLVCYHSVPLSLLIHLYYWLFQTRNQRKEELELFSTPLYHEIQQDQLSTYASWIEVVDSVCRKKKYLHTWMTLN